MYRFAVQLIMLLLLVGCGERIQRSPQPWEVEPIDEPKPNVLHYFFNYKRSSGLHYPPNPMKTIELSFWSESSEDPLSGRHPDGSWISKYKHLWYHVRDPFDHDKHHYFQCGGTAGYEVDDYIFTCSGKILIIYIKPGSAKSNLKKDPVPAHYHSFFYTKDIETRQRVFEVDVFAPDGKSVRLTYAFDAMLYPRPFQDSDGRKYWQRLKVNARFVKARYLQQTLPTQ